MKIDLQVVSRPVTVEFECPHCMNDAQIDYSDFNDLIGEPYDWKYSKVDCPECGKSLEIDDVDWD